MSSITVYRYRLRCPDCLGIDELGCFDGQTDLSEDSYPTEQDAIDAAEKVVADCIWQYDIQSETIEAESLND